MGRAPVLIVVAALAAGCGAGTEHAGSGKPIDVVRPAPLTTRIIDATPKQRAVLVEILRGLGPTKVEAVEVAERGEAMPGPADGVVLNIEIPLDDRVANWHMDLIAEAFWWRSRELGLPPVVFYSGGHGGSSFYDDPAMSHGDPGLTLVQAREIAEGIEEMAPKRGARVRRLELLRPRRFAFLVVLQADDPADFLLKGYDDVMKPIDELHGRGYDGASIEVLDGEGRFVMASGGWFSVRTDVAACAHYQAGERGSPTPPPCPAG